MNLAGLELDRGRAGLRRAHGGAAPGPGGGRGGGVAGVGGGDADGGDEPSGMPPREALNSMCPTEMASCDADPACSGEVTQAEGQNPPPGTDPFNAVVECLIIDMYQHNGCGSQVNSCWLDDACRGVMWMADGTDAEAQMREDAANALERS